MGDVDMYVYRKRVSLLIPNLKRSRPPFAVCHPPVVKEQSIIKYPRVLSI